MIKSHLIITTVHVVDKNRILVLSQPTHPYLDNYQINFSCTENYILIGTRELINVGRFIKDLFDVYNLNVNDYIFY